MSKQFYLENYNTPCYEELYMANFFLSYMKTFRVMTKEPYIKRGSTERWQISETQKINKNVLLSPFKWINKHEKKASKYMKYY